MKGKKKKEKRLKNRWGKLLYLFFLIGATILVSCRGGNISYLLFYFALLLPMLAFLYSLYVFYRFKIVQDVSRVVVKAQEVPYRLLLANEDFLPFTHIRLHFFSDMVRMKPADPGVISLLPHEEIRVDTKMYCKYRGTYPVGVKSVEVTDFLGLFTIRYPMMSQIRLTARPRIIPLEQLKIVLQEQDPKNSLFPVSRLQDLPDYELRSYLPGDSRKYIHWKNSARTGELLVRKQMPEELFETILFMDLTPQGGGMGAKRPMGAEPSIKIKYSMEEVRSMEDNIIETALSFVHDYYLKNIPIRVLFMEDSLREILVDESTGFEPFYDKCSELSFVSPYPLEKVWDSFLSSSGGPNAYILVTAAVTDALARSVAEKQVAGNEVLLVNVGELSL